MCPGIYPTLDSTLITSSFLFLVNTDAVIKSSRCAQTEVRVAATMGDEKWDRRVGGGGRARQREGALIEWSASFWLVIQILCFFIIKRLSVLILLQDNLPFELSPLVNGFFFFFFLTMWYAWVNERVCIHLFQSRNASTAGPLYQPGITPARAWNQTPRKSLPI